MIRAGTRNSGSSISAARVSGQEMKAMAVTMNTSETTLLTTPESVEVKAC